MGAFRTRGQGPNRQVYPVPSSEPNRGIEIKPVVNQAAIRELLPYLQSRDAVGGTDDRALARIMSLLRGISDRTRLGDTALEDIAVAVKGLRARKSSGLLSNEYVFTIYLTLNDAEKKQLMERPKERHDFTAEENAVLDSVSAKIHHGLVEIETAAPVRPTRGLQVSERLLTAGEIVLIIRGVIEIARKEKERIATRARVEKFRGKPSK